MREAQKEVEGIFSDFDFLAGFEVEGAKARFDRCFFEELWVEIGYGERSSTGALPARVSQPN